MKSERRIRIGLLILLLFATAQATTAAPPAPSLKGYVQPFTYDPLTEPFIVIPVTINGQTLPFMLDTGTSWPILIDSWAAKKLRLRPAEKPTYFSDNHTKAFQTVLHSLRLFGSTGTNFPSALITDLHQLDDAYAGPRLAGILGVSLLTKAVVQFDLQTRHLIVALRHRPLHHRPDASVLPMQLRPDGLYTVTISPQPGLSIPLVLDTGATFTSLPAGMDQRLASSRTVPFTSMSFTGERSDTRILLPRVQIGSFSESNVVVGSWTLQKAGLGMDLLSRFRVTVDFPHRTLILERPADYSKRVHVPGFAGLILEPQKQGWIVDLALDVSGAPAAGIRRGDRVLSIDGRSLHNLPPLVVDHLLDGWAGSQAVLVVQHEDGKKAPIRFTRASIFSPAVQAYLTMLKSRSVKKESFTFDDLGFTLGPGKDGLFVTNLSDGSVAAKAGVLKGDKVLRLNDFSLDKITDTQMVAVVNSPEITLKIQRNGEEKPREFHLRAK